MRSQLAACAPGAAGAALALHAPHHRGQRRRPVRRPPRPQPGFSPTKESDSSRPSAGLRRATQGTPGGKAIETATWWPAKPPQEPTASPSCLLRIASTHSQVKREKMAEHFAGGAAAKRCDGNVKKRPAAYADIGSVTFLRPTVTLLSLKRGLAGLLCYPCICNRWPFQFCSWQPRQLRLEIFRKCSLWNVFSAVSS
jgi:hypothetical protein